MQGLKRSLGSLALIAGVGCGGGGSSGSSCGAPACGGDVVGRWVVSSACVDDGAFSKLALGSFASCSGASISHIAAMPSGEVTFNADLSYTISLSTDVTYEIGIPVACFDGGDCSSADTQFIENVTGYEGVGSVACAGTTSCACNAVGELNFGQSRDSADSSGTYALSGSTLSISSSVGVDDSGPYCVQGNTLHLTLTGMSSGMSVTASNLVFSKG